MTKFCPFCGEELVDNAKFCKNCGENVENLKGATQENVQNQEPPTFDYPVAEKEHTLAIVLGYLFAVLIPLIGFIIAIYLLTRNDSSKAKKHGKYVLIVAVVIWVLSMVAVMMGF
jgi:uncharacterized membrane protein YvbJ